MEDLPQEFMVENSFINLGFLENKTGKITAVVYLIAVSEIVNGVQLITAGTLLIVNNYILDLIWGNDSIYQFDSHIKDENANFWSSGQFF